MGLPQTRASRTDRQGECAAGMSADAKLPHGSNFCLCRACGLYFYNVRAFDTHRAGRRCLSEAELRDRPDRARAMREAILRGWEYALAHREEIIEWILTHLPADDRSPGRTREWLRYEADATAKLINADLVELGHMNPGRWQRMADLTVALGQARSTERLRGFMFEVEKAPAPKWIRWVFGGLGVTVIVAPTTAKDGAAAKNTFLSIGLLPLGGYTGCTRQ